MERAVNKILLFTLSACPMGRSMGSVLREVERIFDKIELETIFVDVQTELTNQYRVKANPTTMFLDQEGKELYRIEGFQETEQVIDLIERLERQDMDSAEQYEENQATLEQYTVYLYQNDSLVAVEIPYENKTSVRAPRITAIKVQLQAQEAGYQNPFPRSASLELVQFKGSAGDIVINMKNEDEQGIDKEKMRLALSKTLSHFGVAEIELTLTKYPV
ncbi:thioredoxin family protein [Paenibacillus chondroitinus]|uniref:Thioredoxin family protein n=1 Tax=Paenibacillus chondroitinus TaxID=59842 RepID=A0ABU6DKZ2_9BACL|nr:MULTISPECIES: thioredoxin family protein [Paenibacillus]MCY9657167.1 thioredoxin family protein [Paenibacillus anseongense]MEB4798450.1 thioredoxin family protein [Paenibacillus chondroitinus]